MSQILSPGTTAPDFSLHVTPDQKLSLSELKGKPVVLAFYPRRLEPRLRRSDGLVQRDPCRNFISTEPKFLESQSTASGATPHFRKIATCTSPCSRILNRRDPSPPLMEPIERRTASPSERCSSSTRTASSSGAIVRPSP